MMAALALLSAPKFGNYLERARRRRLSVQHPRKDFIFWAEGHRTSLLHRQNQVHSGGCGRAVRNHDRDATAGADAENGLGRSRIPFRMLDP